MSLESSLFLNDDKILALGKLIVDLPGYEINSRQRDGGGTRIISKLDHIQNGIYSGAGLKPEYTTENGKVHIEEVFRAYTPLRQWLTARAISLQGDSMPADALAISQKPPPLASDVKKIFAGVYDLFDPQDSYGQFGRSVLQHAATVLGLDELSKGSSLQSQAR